MKNFRTRLILLLILLLGVFPNGAFAYSYGDPSKEDVAETFKLVVSKINSSDWVGAVEAYKVRRSEISSHFGENVAVTLDMNLEAKDKVALIANYQAVLIMNLERRFAYGYKDINDYSKAKLLLAKAKGTYDVLDPYIPKSISKDQLKTSFDLALEALGNPGLFGVGEKPINANVFKKETDFIISQLKPLFPYKEVKKTTTVGTTPTEKPVKKEETNTQPKQETKTQPKQETKTQPKQETKTLPKQETKTQPKLETTKVKTKENNTAQENTATKTVAVSNTEESAKSKKTSDSTEAEKTDEEQTVTVDEATSNEEETQEEFVNSEETVEAENELVPNSDEDSKAEDVETTEVSTDVSDAALDANHAPMERIKKTNPFVSIALILGLVIVGFSSIWFLKRKGII